MLGSDKYVSVKLDAGQWSVRPSKTDLYVLFDSVETPFDPFEARDALYRLLRHGRSHLCRATGKVFKQLNIYRNKRE